VKRTIWLASYPKSGSTWFRLLIANLDAERPVDINSLHGRGGIASARARFDNLLLFPSGLLTHDECDRLRPSVYRAMADGARPPRGDNEHDDDEAGAGDVRFVKTHDAWTITADGEPLLGGVAAAHGAILIARDPRDVAPSLANHNGQPIDQAIAFMADPEAAFCGRIDRQQNQLRQQLPGWSGYHRSWLDQTMLPLHLIRYEDLHEATAEVLAGALAFAGVTIGAAAIERAVHFASFSELERQEREAGFREAPPGRKGAFFRRGIAGGWRDELMPGQARAIETAHGAMMARLGYACAPGQGDAM